MYYVHKDRDPKDTIQIIRKILLEANLFPFESTWNVLSRHCNSLALNDLTLPNIHVNGKGITPEYALASAYGELIERVQNRTLVRKQYGLMTALNVPSADECFKDIGTLIDEQPQAMSHLLDVPFDEAKQILNGIPLLCAPFYNVTDNRVDMLPIDMIRRTHNHNGLCAGNTIEEALCHAICEICERYVLKRLYTEDHRLPTIPLKEIESLKVFELVREVQQLGFDVVIKDCSVVDNLPVSSVILLGENGRRAGVEFGADPLFEVALARCITEKYQGYTAEKARDSRTWGQTEYLHKGPTELHYFASVEKEKDYHRMLNTTIPGQGRLPTQIYYTNGEPHYKEVFQKTFVSHRHSLHALADLIHRNGYKIYCRNVSHLGFPALRVFVPGMSELAKLTREELQVYFVELPFLRKCLLRLKNVTADEIGKCAALLDALMEVPHRRAYKERILFDLTEVVFDKKSNFALLENIEFLLALLFSAAGKHGKASKYLSQYVEENWPRIRDSRYFMGVIAFLKMKDAGSSNEQIRFDLENIYGASTAIKVCNDLCDPGKTLEPFELPACGNCEGCPAVNSCSYQQWKVVSEHLAIKEMENPVLQADLAPVFGKACVS